VTSDAEERDVLPDAALLAELPAVSVTLHDHPTVRAWRKGMHVAAEHPQALVVAADTIVVIDGDVLNKPVDEADAWRMLRRLSGRRHTVYTGVMIAASGHPMEWHVVASQVEMRQLDDATIAAYVATGEPRDKAGAYGIQGVAGTLVVAVHGSFTNVVGLPLRLIHDRLRAHQIAVAHTPDAAYRWWRQQLTHQQMPDGSDV
jgi:septum formation protein